MQNKPRFLQLWQEYAKLVRKTKHEKWKDYASSSTTIPLQAKLLTLISHEPSPELGPYPRCAMPLAFLKQVLKEQLRGCLVRTMDLSPDMSANQAVVPVSKYRPE